MERVCIQGDDVSLDRHTLRRGAGPQRDIRACFLGDHETYVLDHGFLKPRGFHLHFVGSRLQVRSREVTGRSCRGIFRDPGCEVGDSNFGVRDNRARVIRDRAKDRSRGTALAKKENLR